MEDLSIGDSSADYEIDWLTNTSGYQQIVTQVKGQGFTIWDHDTDTWSGGNCALENVGYNGGWWYTNCYQLSMLHSNGDTYSWRSNVSDSVSYLYLWFREI